MITAKLKDANALRIQDAIAGAPRRRKDKRGRSWRIGHVAGKIVRQLVFREGTGELEEFWIHKTVREWCDEIGCTPRELQTVVRVLAEEGLLETKQGYRPSDRRQTTYYRLNLWAVLELVDPAGAAEIGPTPGYPESWSFLEEDEWRPCRHDLCEGCDECEPEGPAEDGPACDHEYYETCERCETEGESADGESTPQTVGVPPTNCGGTYDKLEGYPPQSAPPTEEYAESTAVENAEIPPGGASAASRQPAPLDPTITEQGNDVEDHDTSTDGATSEQKAAGEEEGRATCPDHEAPLSEETPKEPGDEPGNGYEAWKALVLGRPAPITVASRDLDQLERSKVSELVWNDPADGNPVTVPGRYALAHVLGKEIGGAPVAALTVAEKVREHRGSRHPVQAYVDTVGRALEALRADVLAQVAV